MFSSRFHDLTKAFDSTIYTDRVKKLSENNALDLFFELLQGVQHKKGVVYVIGNGGSAGIASHFSTDLIKSLKIPSTTLFDSNLVTCLSNDYGYETVFSYPLQQLGKSEDLLVAISSSGKSPNIIRASEVAVEKNIPLITLSGFSESNPLRVMGNLNFWVNQSDYGLIETTHFFLLHTIVDYWNQQMRVKEYARVLGSATKQS